MVSSRINRLDMAKRPYKKNFVKAKDKKISLILQIEF
jgi:hypothetical protein